MKKKSFSLQKLPEIYKVKKQRFVQKNEEFQQKVKPIEKQEVHNELMMFKLKAYETTRTIGRQSNRKQQQRAARIITLIAKHQRLVGDLQSIKQTEFKVTQPKSFIRSSSIRVPGKKMDVESYVKQKNDKLIEEDLKTIEIQNHRRQYLPSIVQSEKKLLPFYNQTEKKYQNSPFTKLQETKDNVKVRFLNGFEKWIVKKQIKQIQQNEPLTLESYRKLIKKEPVKQISPEEQMKRKQIIEKINIDKIFLQKMLTQVFNKKNPRNQIRSILREQLYSNYEQSVKAFNIMFVEQRQVKHINRFEKKNPVQQQLKDKMNHELLCSYNLQFLELYMLSKNNYISLMVQSYNIIRKLEQFNHFTLLYKLNDTPHFKTAFQLAGVLQKQLLDQRAKIQNIIFSLQQHLNLLLSVIRKDIEHVIFLNPRLVGTDYQKYIKIFIASFSEHLSKIIRSVIIHAINEQLQLLVQFYKDCVKMPKRCIWGREQPKTTFYADIHTKNYLLYCQFIGEAVENGPGIIPVTLSLKKWKKKKYHNIYRFVIQSRQKIREFSIQNWNNYRSSQERITFQEPLEQLQAILVNPIKQYFLIMDQSENVNGCIFNKNINLITFLNTQRFINEMKQIYSQEKEEKIRMYVAYFQLWQHYYMQKPYIDDFIHLYKKINTIKLIQEEMNCLKADLALLKSFPNIISLHLVRLDITAIKQKIQSTIQLFMKKLLKASQESVAKMLEYGSDETAKAKKLSQVTPYTNLAQYIQFVSFLKRKQVQKSIKTIAESVVFIDLNYIFLTDNHIDIKPAMLQRYLECGTWIKQIRMAAKQNKKKMSVDPYTFLKGVKDKKLKIFIKYNKILKEIIEMLKVSELKNAIKLSVLSQNIAQEMKQICGLADQISRQQKLLELEYYPTEPSLIVENKIYRSDLTFFHRQYQFLKKYLHFWTYVTKLKVILENITEQNVLSFDGIQFVRLLREGQELLSSIKLSTLNKRFLHLCDQVNRQVEPYLKCSKLFLIIVSGSQHYRLKVLKEITRQTSSQEVQKDPTSIKIKQLLSLSWNSLDWIQIYRIREEDKVCQQVTSKLNSIYLVIKNLEIKLYYLQGVGRMKNYQILKVDEQIVQILKYCCEVVKVIDQKYGKAYHKMDYDEQILSQTVKKMNIFYRSVLKLKTCFQKIVKYYSLFELFQDNLFPHFQAISLNHYLTIFQSIMLDYGKKTDLVKKLSYTTLYDDKIRVNYDQQLKKLEQFQIKMYNEVIDKLISKSTYFSNSEVDKQNIFECFCHLALPDSNLHGAKLFGGWCTAVKFQLQYSKDYYIVLTEIKTIHKQTIKVDFRQKLIEISKEAVNGDQELQISCGLLKIVEEVNAKLQQKVQQQTKMILKLVYGFQYSTKHVFQLFIYVNNLLFQPLLNALMIAFYIDLGMLWENKYDLNLLAQLIKENKHYVPKQMQNLVYVDVIIKVLQEFEAVIDFLQEREYGIEDVQKGRVKKTYAYNSIPKIAIHHFKEHQNKIWLNSLKQQKQDDFITNTHLNPALSYFHLLELDSTKIEARQIEKKDHIQNLFEGQLNIYHMLIDENDSSKLEKYANIRMKINVVSNLAPQYGLKESSFAFGFSLVNRCQYQHYLIQSFRATSLLIDCRSISKILVTNIHPNYQLLGKNFIKTNKFIQNHNQNMAIIVYSQKELLNAVKQLKYNRINQQSPFVYIYYDRLHYQNIKTQDVAQYCVVFQIPRKLQINNLLKKSLNYSQQQIFNTFIQSKSNFSKCYPFIDSQQVLISLSMLRNNFDLKQREIAISFILNFQRQHGQSQKVSQINLAMLYQPVFILAKTHFLQNHFYELAAHVYMKAKTIQTNFADEATNDVVGSILKLNYENILAFYKIPIHCIAEQELFNETKVKQYQTVIQDKFKKDIQHVRVSKKPYFQLGYIQELLHFAIGQMPLSSRLQKFRIKGENSAKVKWFILDLSVQSEQGYKVFNFFAQSFASNQYVLYNQQYIPTQVHYQQKMLKNQNHKIILLLNHKYLQNYKTDFPSIPVLNQCQLFQPLNEFKLGLKKIQNLPQQFTKLINFQNLFELFKKCLNLVKQEWLSVDSMIYFNNLLFILCNQVRKREIGVGHYCQQELSHDQSKENMLGSIDLREKTKLTHQQALQIQQIQKKMDLTRRQIYKCFTQNNKYEQLLTEQIQQNLNKEYEILNPSLHSYQQINQIMSSVLLFAFYYSIALPNPQSRVQLSQCLQILTNRSNLYMYCFSIMSKSWERWQEINSELTQQSCNSSPSSKILSPKEIIRLNRSKQRLTALSDLVQDLKTIKSQKSSLINLKGAEIYFSKLLILYQLAFHIQVPKNDYPKWAFQYEFQIMAQQSKSSNLALRAIPQSSNKKLSKYLMQTRLNTKFVKSILIDSKEQINIYSQQIGHNLAFGANQWYKSSNSSLFFISIYDQNKESELNIKKNANYPSLVSQTIKIRCDNLTLNPYRILTNIHSRYRFSDMESNLINVLISLKTYERRFDYQQHHRFKEYSFKNVDQQERLEIFGFQFIVSSLQVYQEYRKKIKETLYKIKMQDSDSKQQLTVEQIEKLTIFDRYTQVSFNLQKLLSCLEVKRKELSRNYVLRYMLKKPKRYQKIQNQQSKIKKKRIKQPVRNEFDDMLIYTELYDKSNLLDGQLNQLMLFFSLKQRVLLIENKQNYSQMTKLKCVKAYRYYRLAIQTMLTNKNYKAFALDLSKLVDVQPSIRQLGIYNLQSLTKLKEQFDLDLDKQKLVLLFLYNKSIFKEVVGLLNTQITMHTKFKKHHYILFAMQIQKNNHGFRFIVQQGSQLENINYLSQILDEKKIHLQDKLEKLIQRRAKQLMFESEIGTQYIVKATEKLTDIKLFTQQIRTELNSKKQMLDKSKSQIQQSKKVIAHSKQSIIQAESQIKILESQLYYWRLKKQFYGGDRMLRDINKKLRELNRKKLQKQVNNNDYLQENPFNISYVYMFNILADNSYFPDKSSTLLQQEYELNKNYQLPDDQKRQYQKLFNYGRLNALIDNDEIVFQNNLITVDQLMMCDKVRNKFVYLRSAHQKIAENKKYSNEHLFTLQQVFSLQSDLISKKGGSQLSCQFNLYLIYLFGHKYIQNLTSQTLNDIQNQLKKSRELILKLKEKIENQQLKLSANIGYLNQIQLKYQNNTRQLQICKRNQQVFTELANQNITLISMMFLRMCFGFSIAFNFDLEHNYQLEQKRSKTAKSKKDKKRKKIEEDDELGDQVEKEEKQQGQFKQIVQKASIYSLCQYIIEQLPKQTRRQLSDIQSQLVLCLLPSQTILQILKQKKVQNIDEMYQGCLTNILRQMYGEQVIVFKKRSSDELFEPYLDHRKHNIIDLTLHYRSNTHYFTKQIEPQYSSQITGLINRLSTKNGIVNTNIKRLTQKLEFVQSKSSQLISKFKLSDEALQSIQESIINGLKLLTNTAVESMYYFGEWNAKNGQKIQYYKKVTLKIQQLLKRAYGERFCQAILIYYLRLVGMIGRKVSLSYLQDIMAQLLYDHSNKKDDKQKEIMQISISKQTHKIQQKESFQIQLTQVKGLQKLQKLKKNHISTMGSILFTPFKVILVHGDQNCVNILNKKAYKSNKILKKIENIEYYAQQNKSKEYWLVAAVKFNSKLSQIVDKIKVLQQKVELSQELHMKYIIFFQGKSWTQQDLEFVQKSIQPVYRFYYFNSATSVYYHTYHLVRQNLSTVTKNFEIQAIFNIILYFCPQLKHVAYQHIDFSELDHPKIIEIIQNLFEMNETAAQSIECRIFSLLVQIFKQIKNELTDKLAQAEKQYIAYIPLHEQINLYEVIRNQFDFEDKIQKESTLLTWLNHSTISFYYQQVKKAIKTEKVALAELMKMGNVENQNLMHIDKKLSDPYIFLYIYKKFLEFFSIMLKVIKKKNKFATASPISIAKTKGNTLFQVTNKEELFTEIFNESVNLGSRINGLFVQLDKKQKNRSIGVWLKIVGTQQNWLKQLFEQQLYLNIVDRKYKNVNELNYIKGVFFKYSENVIYVKKETKGDFGQDDTTVTKPLPQHKAVLPVYSSSYEYLGVLQATTNKIIENQSKIYITIQHNEHKLMI